MKEGNTLDRELTLSATLNAPIAVVWDAWTKPEQISLWWGPSGFSTTISVMDLHPGGKWDLVLHGPDGTDYKNNSVFKEIIPLRKIVYDHISGPKFTATISFQEQGDVTLLQWRMLFPTAELFTQTVKTFRADQGLKENIEKLTAYVSGLTR